MFENRKDITAVVLPGVTVVREGAFGLLVHTGNSHCNLT